MTIKWRQWSTYFLKILVPTNKFKMTIGFGIAYLLVMQQLWCTFLKWIQNMNINMSFDAFLWNIRLKKYTGILNDSFNNWSKVWHFVLKRRLCEKLNMTDKLLKTRFRSFKIDVEWDFPSFGCLHLDDPDFPSPFEDKFWKRISPTQGIKPRSPGSKADVLLTELLPLL